MCSSDTELFEITTSPPASSSGHRSIEWAGIWKLMKKRQPPNELNTRLKILFSNIRNFEFIIKEILYRCSIRMSLLPFGISDLKPFETKAFKHFFQSTIAEILFDKKEIYLMSWIRGILDFRIDYGLTKTR